MNIEVTVTKKTDDHIKDVLDSVTLLRNATDEDLQHFLIKSESLLKSAIHQQDKLREERFNKIENHTLFCQKEQAAADMIWSELKTREECQQLHEVDYDIETNKEAILAVVRQCDELIESFNNEIKESDDEFVNLLKSQAQDVQSMICLMRDQHTRMRDKRFEELNGLESNFIQDRSALITEFQQEIQALFDRHAELEREFLEKHDKADEENRRKIEELRIKGAKEYAELKLTMEAELQGLENCLEDMKALYIMNTEKMDYNLKVLKEKHDENAQLYDQLKRKNAALSNRLRTLLQDFMDLDRKFKGKNRELTQEYKRITKSFKELQRKFKHFEKADTEKYNEIQARNEEEVRRFHSKLISCDVTIHVQQLGLQWVQPITDTDIPDTHDNDEDLESDAVSFPVSEERLEQLLKMLLERSNFLIDDRLRDMLATLSQREAVFKQLEVIKKCLEIDSIDEFFIFLEEMVKAIHIKPEPMESTPSQITDKEPEDQGGSRQGGRQRRGRKQQESEKVIPIEEPGVIEDEVLDLNTVELDENLLTQFLTEWMKTKGPRKQSIEQMSSRRSIKHETEREKKERIAREGKKYWKKLTSVLPEQTFKIWQVLDKALEKYHKQLQMRQKLLNETKDLHEQNEELKALLNQYMKIDHELIIPPTKLIHVEEWAMIDSDNSNQNEN